jgi:DNA-binding phage protein
MIFMAKGNLTRNQQKALEVLITSGNVSEVADAAGVKRQTIYTWKEEN